MVIDLRKQKRIIKIELEMTGCNYDLDKLIDLIMPDLITIYKQRDLPEGIKIEIIVE